jgi:hypothetical protein
MDPVSTADLYLALWGVLGAAANLGVVYVEASRRVKGWPWARPHGPGGGVYAASIVVQLGIAAVTTAAVTTAGIAVTGFIAFGFGATAPVVIKKLSAYAQGLVPSPEEPGDRRVVEDARDGSAHDGGDRHDR